MTHTPASSSFDDAFIASFGRLVVLLRQHPEDVASQKRALRSAMSVLPRGPVRIEVGIEHSEVPDEASLTGRLLIRRVDAIHFAPSATAAEVLTLARSLASDLDPVPSTPAVAAALLPDSGGVRPDLPAATPLAFSLSLPQQASITRHRTMAGPVAEADHLVHAMESAAATDHWLEAVHAAQALIRMTARFPAHEQRIHMIGLRRVLTRPLLEQFINFAMRVAEEQPRVAEILQHAGPDGIETMVDQISRAEAVGPRKFLHDALAATPQAQPMLQALLTSPEWHQARHGAELLGRLGQAESIEPLRAALRHPDERVRQAVVEALGRFPGRAVIEPIRRALSDPAAPTRISAAHALAQRNAPGVALPIAVALESEKDPAVWEALVEALVRIDSGEALNALVEITVDKRPLLRTGRPRAQRLAVVNALRKSGTDGARKALERLAIAGDASVRRAAAAAIGELSGGE